MAEDPRELARRLAEEAKAKLKTRDEDPRELARRLAEEAKRKAAQAAPAPAPSAEPSVAGAPPEKLTAKQALAREREMRRQRQASTPIPAPAPAPAAPRALPPRSAPDATMSSETTSPGGSGAVAKVIHDVLPGAGIVFQSPVTQVEVARALWRSHQARAQQDQDPQLVTTAAVILDALDRVPMGHLVAARATVNGKDWAFWVDLSRQTVLATAYPAEVYLAGM
ncbi:MAG: hypothetical protein AAF211_19750 [Myxococcota bacterium]